MDVHIDKKDRTIYRITVIVQQNIVTYITLWHMHIHNNKKNRTMKRITVIVQQRTPLKQYMLKQWYTFINKKIVLGWGKLWTLKCYWHEYKARPTGQRQSHENRASGWCYGAAPSVNYMFWSCSKRLDGHLHSTVRVSE